MQLLDLYLHTMCPEVLHFLMCYTSLLHVHHILVVSFLRVLCTRTASTVVLVRTTTSGAPFLDCYTCIIELLFPVILNCCSLFY